MKEYIEANKDRFLEELFSLLRIPSVSSLEAHRPDMERCAGRLAELLKQAGADEAGVYPTAGHPWSTEEAHPEKWPGLPGLFLSTGIMTCSR